MVLVDAVDRMSLYFDGPERITTLTRPLPLIAGVDVDSGADFEVAQHFFTDSIGGMAVDDQALRVDQIRAAYSTGPLHGCCPWLRTGVVRIPKTA